jgi:hypothetical protein
VGQVLFVFRDHTAIHSVAKGKIHRMHSLPGLNRLLVHGGAAYKTSQTILDAFNYVGIIDNPDRSSRMGPMAKSALAVTDVVVGGQTLAINYWAATYEELLPGEFCYKKGLPESRIFNNKSLIHLWLLLVKVDKHKLAQGLSGVGTGKRSHAIMSADDQVWQFVPFCTTTACKPHYSFFTSPGWIGDCVYIGQSLDERGENTDPAKFHHVLKEEILTCGRPPAQCRLPQFNILVR